MSNANKKHILQHFRTSESGKTISPSAVTYGEIVMNYNADTPMLMFKDSNDEIQKISPNKLSNTYNKVVYPTDTGDKTFTPAVSGQTLDEAVFTVESNLSTLVQAVLENEEVTAAAFTELKESVGLDENLKYVADSNANYISAATTLSEADSLLDSAIANISSSIPSLDGYATEEYVTTQVNALIDNAPDALNTLNELSAALNDDANFATTVTNSIATKANSDDVYTKTESDAKYSLTSHTHDIYALQTALDTANNTINTLQTTVTDLTNKLNAIIAAVGLNSDGTFIVPTSGETSGYTTAATSIMSAIYLMDNQIEENETVAAYALTDLNNRLEEEIERVDEFEEVSATAITDLNERLKTLENA